MKITEAQLVKATKAAAKEAAGMGYFVDLSAMLRLQEQVRAAFAAVGVTVKPERKKR